MTGLAASSDLSPATYAGWSFGSQRIKDQIEAHLAPLVGLPLIDASRTVDMATFGFGRRLEPQGPPGRAAVPEYRLHIQETWRIIRDGAVFLGYGDWHYPPRGSTAAAMDFVERDERRNRQDDLRDDWIAHGAAAHTVREVSGSHAGDLTVAFADGCQLETFVNQSSVGGDGDGELWRLLPPPLNGDEPHFVISAWRVES